LKRREETPLIVTFIKKKIAKGYHFFFLKGCITRPFLLNILYRTINIILRKQDAKEKNKNKLFSEIPHKKIPLSRDRGI
tara:strand:- start:164 stop:400 length:237 start_codon:yes stop_codon:yes gene_type:complete